jgi:hypothetical protein
MSYRKRQFACLDDPLAIDDMEPEAIVDGIPYTRFSCNFKPTPDLAIRDRN